MEVIFESSDAQLWKLGRNELEVTAANIMRQLS